MEPQTDLGVEISSLALVDTHEHLLPEDQWAGDNARLIEDMREAGQPGWGDARPDILQDLFMNYVRSDLEVAGARWRRFAQLFDPAAGDIESRFSGIRERGRQRSSPGYGEAVRLIAREVYGLDSLTAEGLEARSGSWRSCGGRANGSGCCARSPVLITCRSTTSVGVQAR